MQTENNAPVSTLTFDAPTDGIVHITASTSVEGAGTGGDLYAYLRVDGDIVRQTYWLIPAAGNNITQTLTAAVAVPEGTHELVLRVTGVQQATDLYLPQIAAVFAPAGDAGTVIID